MKSCKNEKTAIDQQQLMKGETTARLRSWKKSIDAAPPAMMTKSSEGTQARSSSSAGPLELEISSSLDDYLHDDHDDVIDDDDDDDDDDGLDHDDHDYGLVGVLPSGYGNIRGRDAAHARRLRRRRVAVLCAVACLSVLVLGASVVAGIAVFGGGGGRRGAGGVPPVYGSAFLSPEEYLDVRLSSGRESVLVTGGLGFIGSHVVDLLLHRGYKVTILDDESNGHNHNVDARELVPKDITVVNDFPEYPTTTAATTMTGDATTNEDDDDDDDDRRFTHVIHLAAAISVAESMSDPDKYERVNYGGSQKVLDWIGGYNERVFSLLLEGRGSGSGRGGGGPFIRKVVAASSAAIYGDPDPALLPLRESVPYGGKSPYADTKYRMEGLMRDFATGRDDGVGAIALRFFNVYGPRQDPRNPYSGVISLFLEMAGSGRDITILGDGEMTRDFVYVKDVARAIVLALLREEDEGGRKKKGGGASFDVYNVCTGVSITINALAERVRSSMGSTSNIVHAEPREGDIRESGCDPRKARDGMGFVAAVSQEDGLEKTAAWFRSRTAK